ncbi:MAG TPA: hypothetical protein VJ911_00135, partial [Cryomorphaceae bacterium]|nr:hypothetical protein [Cryomorphaceae bacterium]
QDKDGNKFEFDENFDLIRRMNPAHVYEISQFLSEDQFIITNGLRSFWVKANGEKVLPFSFTRNLKVMKKSVLDVDENKVLVYPLSLD